MSEPASTPAMERSRGIYRQPTSPGTRPSLWTGWNSARTRRSRDVHRDFSHNFALLSAVIRCRSCAFRGHAPSPLGSFILIDTPTRIPPPVLTCPGVPHGHCISTPAETINLTLHGTMRPPSPPRRRAWATFGGGGNYNTRFSLGITAKLGQNSTLVTQQLPHSGGNDADQHGKRAKGLCSRLPRLEPLAAESSLGVARTRTNPTYAREPSSLRR
ncbi:hypothetical protein VTK56DRAFT_3558 [Thermocarpiscus australiensis]